MTNLRAEPDSPRLREMIYN
jgi:hypothetical protein